MTDHRALLNWALDPKATREQLEQVAASDSISARCHLVRRHDCPADLLAQLAEDNDPRVVRGAVANLALGEETLLGALLEMAQGSVSDRVVAVQLPRCPLPVLERLACDPIASIAAVVARHPNCSAALRQRLVGELMATPAPDAYPLLADLDGLSTEQLVELAESGPRSTPYTLLQRPDLPEEVIYVLADNKPTEIRAMAVNHPNCPEWLLDGLEDDPELWVRAGIALNPQYDPILRERRIAAVVDRMVETFHTSNEGEAWVRPAIQWVLFHPLTPPLIRESLVCRTGEPDASL